MQYLPNMDVCSLGTERCWFYWLDFGSLSPAVLPYSFSNKQRNLIWPMWYLNADMVMLTATEISFACVYNGTAQWGSFDDIPKNSHIS